MAAGLGSKGVQQQAYQRLLAAQSLQMQTSSIATQHILSSSTAGPIYSSMSSMAGQFATAYQPKEIPEGVKEMRCPACQGFGKIRYIEEYRSHKLLQNIGLLQCSICKEQWRIKGE